MVSPGSYHSYATDPKTIILQYRTLLLTRVHAYTQCDASHSGLIHTHSHSYCRDLFDIDLGLLFRVIFAKLNRIA